ncbi:sugar phosphate isomerase/epimerase family protein [Aureispira anguillae]|uniref:Sugar phosphate isomerase/epimerase n=1 Tax=Aureispira anguillae TaxID=2864201 RepID=A0A915YII3_9BACT|nr:sugar phosphate isomerase/epimerase family protein [Aureispira anguillae]BDS13718.1 sugar phosphate isomerase/epimerase [Aureispira anguillae]
MNIPILVSVANVTPEVLQRLEQQGVGIELSYFSYPSSLENDNLQAQIQAYKTMLKDFSQPVTMHGAFYDLSMTAREPKIVAVTRFRINQSLDIAIELGIKKLVFHTNYLHSQRPGYKEIWVKKQVDFWRSFIPKIEQHQLVLHLENTREEDYTYIGSILDQLSHPNFKTCYDTGHSHCFTQAQNKPISWVKGYQSHLSYIHLHSNNGRIDQHIAFTKGNVDFSHFFEAIRQLPAPPYLVIEVAQREDYLASLVALRQLGF